MKKLALLSCLMFSGMINSAFACTCATDSFGPEASKKNIARAAHIVQGTITYVSAAEAQDSKDNSGLSSFGIRVLKSFKGGAGPMLAAYVDTSTSCGTSIPQLKRQSFFVLYEKKGKLVLASSCSGYITSEHLQALQNGIYKP